MNYYISLHHTKKLENFNFFRFRHSFRGLTPLKLKNFVQKLKIYPISQIFHNVRLEKVVLLPPFITHWNLTILIFTGFRHLFRGLTPFKFKNFVQKLKISPIPQNN